VASTFKLIYLQKIHRNPINKGERKLKKSQILFSEFVKEDRFVLNEYLISLFNQIREYFPIQSTTEQQENGIKN
jgi:hypothetical protein